MPEPERAEGPSQDSQDYEGGWVAQARTLLSTIPEGSRSPAAQLLALALDRDQDTPERQAYLRGRADERASVIGWLRAESEDEAKADLLRGKPSTWGAAFDWASRALSNIAASSEVQGMAVRRMKLPEDL